MSPQGPETLALLAGRRTDAPTDTVSVPIYQTASYQSAHVANLFALKELDNIYTRIMNVAHLNMWRRAKSMPCINQIDASCATYGEVTGYVRSP